MIPGITGHNLTDMSETPSRHLGSFARSSALGCLLHCTLTAVVAGTESPAPADLRPALQREIEADWINRDTRFAATRGEVTTNFSLAHTREVANRARDLAARLRPTAGAARLDPLEADLTKIEQRLAGFEGGNAPPTGDRRKIHFAARALARRIAFCNPLLDIEQLLFLKRHDSVGVYHMCDQYYGCNARPGGGLFVLSNPFGQNPELTNLLADSVVQNGRLKGRKLDSGTFLSPELSFDGKTILFAYSEAGAWSKYRGKEAYEWKPE